MNYIEYTYPTFKELFCFYRCASNIKEVTETCLSGLVSMLSSRDGNTLHYKF